MAAHVVGGASRQRPARVESSQRRRGRRAAVNARIRAKIRSVIDPRATVSSARLSRGVRLARGKRSREVVRGTEAAARQSGAAVFTCVRVPQEEGAGKCSEREFAA